MLHVKAGPFDHPPVISHFICIAGSFSGAGFCLQECMDDSINHHKTRIESHLEALSPLSKFRAKPQIDLLEKPLIRRCLHIALSLRLPHHLGFQACGRITRERL